LSVSFLLPHGRLVAIVNFGALQPRITNQLPNISGTTQTTTPNMDIPTSGVITPKQSKTIQTNAASPNKTALQRTPIHQRIAPQLHPPPPPKKPRKPQSTVLPPAIPYSQVQTKSEWHITAFPSVIPPPPQRKPQSTVLPPVIPPPPQIPRIPAAPSVISSQVQTKSDCHVAADPNAPKKPRKPRTPADPNAPKKPRKPRTPADPNAPKKPRKPRAPADPNAPKKLRKPRAKADSTTVSSPPPPPPPPSRIAVDDSNTWIPPSRSDNVVFDEIDYQKTIHDLAPLDIDGIFAGRGLPDSFYEPSEVWREFPDENEPV
jgi:hypothetical protein